MPENAPLRPVMVVPDFDRVGGYERQAFFLARHFVRAQTPSMIVTNNPWEQPAREVRDGVRIHRLDPLPRGRCTWPNVFKSFLLFLRSHSADYDVIHCHAFTFLSACCVLVGKILGKPVLVKVATERDVREFHEGRTLAFRVFYPLLRRATRVLSLSDSIRREFLACGFHERQVVLQPNGVDTSTFRPAEQETRRLARAELGYGDEDFVYLYTGRLVRRKGIDVLLKAVALAGSLPRTRYCILGDGEERSALERQARALGIRDRVDFIGEKPAVRSYLAASDAFVFPSRLEGLPNSLLEAMSCGLPPIATRIGGCTDVIQNGSGILVEPDEPEELAQKLRQLRSDPSERRQLSFFARERIRSRFSFERVARDLQVIYRAMVAEAGR